MFGILARSAAEALFVTLLAWVLGKVVAPMVTLMTDGAATKDDLLIQTLQGVGDNFVFVGIVALFLSIIARAIVEGRAGSPGGI